MVPATATPAARLMPTINADGVPVVPMSDEQKYLFDLKGWITLPGLLDEQQLEPIRAHQVRFLYEPETLPPEQRDNHGGPSQVLLDAPAVVGVLNEIISHQPLATEECYGFRFDHTYTSHRKAGHDNFNPHGGGGLFNFSGNSHLYQMHPDGSTPDWCAWCGSSTRWRKGTAGRCSCPAATRARSPGPSRCPDVTARSGKAIPVRPARR